MPRPVRSVARILSFNGTTATPTYTTDAENTYLFDAIRWSGETTEEVIAGVTREGVDYQQLVATGRRADDSLLETWLMHETLGSAYAFLRAYQALQDAPYGVAATIDDLLIWPMLVKSVQLVGTPRRTLSPVGFLVGTSVGYLAQYRWRVVAVDVPDRAEP